MGCPPKPCSNVGLAVIRISTGAAVIQGELALTGTGYSNTAVGYDALGSVAKR